MAQSAILLHAHAFIQEKETVGHIMYRTVQVNIQTYGLALSFNMTRFRISSHIINITL